MQPTLNIRSQGEFLLATIEGGTNTPDAQRRHLHTILGEAKRLNLYKIIILIRDIETAASMSITAMLALAEVIRSTDSRLHIAVVDSDLDRRTRGAFISGAANHVADNVLWVDTLEDALAWLNKFPIVK